MGVEAENTRDELLSVLRELLTKAGADAGGAGLSRSWWGQLTDLGVFALPLAPEAGGLGLSLRDSAAAFEAMGDALTAGPVVWTQLAAFELPEAAVGDWVVAGVDLFGQPADEPVVVIDLAQADRLLVLEERGVVLYDPNEQDVSVLAAPIDPSSTVSRVDAFHGGQVVAGPDRAERLRRVGALLSAAMLVGISEGSLRVARDYAAERHQFGRPIGSFQAIKHLLADAYARTHLARAAVYAAAELEDLWQPGGAELDLSSAKLLAGRAADTNARTAVQVFGGMGFAAETPPHRYLKRAWVLEHEFGTMHDHALLVSDLLDRALPGAPA